MPETTPKPSRFDLRGRSVRQHAARGVLVNTGFSLVVSVVGLVRGFALAAFLTQADYGIWGSVLVIVSMLLLVKQVGIGDKYVQQDEDDQELAFQKAFTLEALVSALGMVLVCAAAPLVALAYGDWDLLLPTLAFAAVLPCSALQMPLAVFYRRMQYVRQAVLQSIEPLVVTVVSLGLAVAGAGYWAIFGGLLAGGYATAVAALVVSPYALRFRYDRGTLQSYWSFSWPIFVAAAGGVVMAFSAIIAGKVALGLAGAGAMTLAANIAAFTGRVDMLISGTLYPAICAAADRVDVLRESFVKSNRLALMWAVPFGIGLSLFADDLVHFVLGEERWGSVVILLQVQGIVAAIGQIGFNWDAYFRARGETRPLAVVSAVTAGTFLVTGIPLLFLTGLRGYAIGIGVSTVVTLLLRARYLGRLFDGFAFGGHVVRSVLPVVPATAAVAVVRLVEDGSRTLPAALGELALFIAICAAATWALERPLLREMAGYLLARRAAAPASG